MTSEGQKFLRIEGARKLSGALSRLAELLPQQIGEIQRRTALEALRRLVFKTPVDTGRARAAWVVGINSRSTYAFATGAARDPGATIKAGVSVIRTAPNFSAIYISNNTPYIEVLENGGFVPQNPGPSKDKRPGRLGRVLVSSGYSVQAPQGMLLPTIMELHQGVHEAIVRSVARQRVA